MSDEEQWASVSAKQLNKAQNTVQTFLCMVCFIRTLGAQWGQDNCHSAGALNPFHLHKDINSLSANVLNPSSHRLVFLVEHCFITCCLTREHTKKNDSRSLSHLANL